MPTLLQSYLYSLIIIHNSRTVILKVTVIQLVLNDQPQPKGINHTKSDSKITQHRIIGNSEYNKTNYFIILSCYKA